MAGWCRAGTHRGPIDVTEGVAIDVGIPLHDHSVVVDLAVAVVVQAVADLRSARIDAVVPVVAVVVRSRGGVAVRTATGEGVTVDVEAVVRDGVAVIVYGIADLGILVVAERIQVVAVVVGAGNGAVGATGGHPVLVGIEAVVGGAVTVIINPVADLGLTGVDGWRIVVAVFGCRAIRPSRAATVRYCRTIGVAVAIDVGAIVRGLCRARVGVAIAVVIDLVADLGSAAEDGTVLIVAIVGTEYTRATGGLEVTICIAVEVLVGQATAVVVNAITDLERSRVDRRIEVVTVTITGFVAVTIFISAIAAGTTHHQVGERGQCDQANIAIHVSSLGGVQHVPTSMTRGIVGFFDST